MNKWKAFLLLSVFTMLQSVAYAQETNESLPDKVIIEPGQVLTINKHHLEAGVLFEIPELIMRNHSKIVLGDDVKGIEKLLVKIGKFTAGKNAEFHFPNTFVGEKGSNGGEGSQGDYGRSGNSGGDGGQGENGRKRVDLFVTIDSAYIVGSLIINVEGSPGAHGGNGGKGGQGGGKRKREGAFKEGQGGWGGRPGPGGVGGAGGNVTFTYSTSTKSLEMNEEDQYPDWLVIKNDGGPGGEPGSPGQGGKGRNPGSTHPPIKKSADGAKGSITVNNI
jgi:hypothetical protein